jgi:hypothetical protein
MEIQAAQVTDPPLIAVKAVEVEVPMDHHLKHQLSHLHFKSLVHSVQMLQKIHLVTEMVVEMVVMELLLDLFLME